VAQHGSSRFLRSHQKQSSYTLASNVNMMRTNQKQ
jgi:hypothetical protein